MLRMNRVVNGERAVTSDTVLGTAESMPLGSSQRPLRGAIW